MPSQFKELCLGINPNGHTKTQVGKQFANGYAYSRTIGWIWSTPDDQMIPIYSVYNSSTQDWKLTINSTALDLGYAWTDPYNSSKTSPGLANASDYIIGYVYPLDQSPPMHLTAICYASRKPTATPQVTDTLITDEQHPDSSNYGSLTNLCYMLAIDTKVADIRFIDTAKAVPLIVPPTITMATPQVIKSSTKIKFDFWVRMTAIVSWDNPTRVAPGLEYTTRIPIVEEYLAHGGVSIPLGSLLPKPMNQKWPQVLTTELDITDSTHPVTFYTGEVNELGYDGDVTITPINEADDDTTKWTAVLLGNQASLSVRFYAMIARGTKGDSAYKEYKEWGTFTCINSTSISSYALKSTTKSDLANVQPFQLGRNGVIQYPAQKGKQEIESIDASRDENSMPMKTSFTSAAPADYQNSGLLITSTIGAIAYEDEADTDYYNNIPSRSK